MAKRRPKKGFQFDVGFSLDGPEGITEKVEQATSELQQVEGRFGDMVLDKLREPAKIITDLQKQPVAGIDAQLDTVTSTVSDLQSRVESNVLGQLGSVGEKLDYLGIVAAPSDAEGTFAAVADLPATSATGPAPAPGSLRAPVEQGGIANSNMQQGEQIPPAAMVAPLAFGIQPGAGGPPPVFGAGWQVMACCDTGKFEIWPPPGVPGPMPPLGIQNRKCILLTVTPTRQDALNAIAAYNRDPVTRDGKLIQLKCCGAGFWKGAQCFGAPPVTPAPAPPPEACPPCPAPAPIAPPSGPTCPPPPPEDPKNWRVSKNTIKCEFYPQKMEEPLPGPSWEIFQAGLTQNQAIQLSRKLTEEECITIGGFDPTVGAISVFDPVCDPIGYCSWYAGAGPPSTGSPGESAKDGPSSALGIDLEKLEQEAGITGRISSAISNGFWGFIGRSLRIADKMLNGFLWPRCKGQAGLVKAHKNLAVLDWATLLLGKSIRRLGTPSEYIANASCPMLFPDEQLASQAFLKGTINRETWECWVAMNNYCPEPYSKVLEASQRRLTIDEAIDLYYQGILSDSELQNVARYNGVFDPKIASQIIETRRAKLSPADVVRTVHRDLLSDSTARVLQRRNGFTSDEEYDAIFDLNTPHFDPDRLLQLWLREKVDDSELEKTLFALGWTRQHAVERWKELANFIPPYTDLTRFMVRDVADDSLVKKFGMDDDFNAKFDGEVKDWAKKQGISEDVMRYVWRAHWSIPSPTQLFQMYHRFRRPDNKYGITIDEDTIRTALQQQDILPFWIDPILKLSFSPLTRIDVRRAYEIGSIDLEQVESAYTELGYSDENAKILADFSKKQLMLKLKRSPQVAKAARLEWTIDELSDWLDGFDMGPEDRDEILSEARRLSARISRAKCAKSVRARFLTGEIDRGQAIRALTNQGHALEVADNAVDGWKCELDSKSKQAQAGQLCKWYEIGLINDTEFVKRLQRIGWSEKDALFTVAECSVRLSIKADKEAERQRKEAERETEKKLRELEKAADKASKQLQKERKERLAELKKQADRDASIVKYAKVHADRFGLSIPETYQVAVSALAQAQQVYGLSDDQAAFVLRTAVETQPKGSQESISSRIAEVAANLASGLSDNPPG